MKLKKKTFYILYCFLQGDNTIFTFEVSDEPPHLFPFASISLEGVHQGISLLPKTACNVRQVEIAKLWRLTQNSVEPVSVTVPRVKVFLPLSPIDDLKGDRFWKHCMLKRSYSHRAITFTCFMDENITHIYHMSFRKFIINMTYSWIHRKMWQKEKIIVMSNISYIPVFSEIIFNRTKNHVSLTLQCVMGTEFSFHQTEESLNFLPNNKISD